MKTRIVVLVLGLLAPHAASAVPLLFSEHSPYKTISGFDSFGGGTTPASYNAHTNIFHYENTLYNLPSFSSNLFLLDAEINDIGHLVGGDVEWTATVSTNGDTKELLLMKGVVQDFLWSTNEELVAAGAPADEGVRSRIVALTVIGSALLTKGSHC